MNLRYPRAIQVRLAFLSPQAGVVLREFRESLDRHNRSSSAVSDLNLSDD